MSNELMHTWQAENQQVEPDDLLVVAARLWNAPDSSPAEKKHTFELLVRAANERSHAPSACVAAIILDSNYKPEIANNIPQDPVRAKELYEIAAAADNPLAIYSLAILLRRGAEGVPQDAVRARELYERAVDAGWVPAMIDLAALLCKGVGGVPQNVVRASELYERAVDAGWVPAMTDLAALLCKGADGVPQDAVRASELYERAVDAGDVTAMVNLGVLLMKAGDGVAQDLVHAKELWERAIDAGSSQAMHNLAFLLLKGGNGVPQDAVQAKELYERAVDMDNVDAMIGLAFLLQNGAIGVEQDNERARALYARAFDTGDVEAMMNYASLLEDRPERVKELKERGSYEDIELAWSNLARMLEVGAEGGAQDAVCIEQLCDRAVADDNVGAITNLATLFCNGTGGIKPDAILAKQLYERAVDAGDLKAMNKLAKLLREGAYGVPQDAVRARELYERAIDGGHVLAMEGLANLLETGAEGVAQDSVRASELYRGAADAGFLAATRGIASLIVKGAKELPQDPVRTKQLYEWTSNISEEYSLKKLANLLRDGREGVAQDPMPALQPRVRAQVEVAQSNPRMRVHANISRDVFVQSTNGNDRSEVIPENFSPLRDHDFLYSVDDVAEVAAAVLGQSALEWSLLRARHFTVGDIHTTRDATEASECYDKAALLATTSNEKALVLTEHARFLLDLEEEASNKSKKLQRQKQAIELLEESFSLRPTSATRNELTHIYTYCPEVDLRNPLRANELKRLAFSCPIADFRKEMTPYFGIGNDSDKRLICLLREAVVKPRSCLLLILGAPKRGKTTTLNSLRGLPFVSEYKSTELAEISQFVMEPDLRGWNDGILRDLDFRENSFRAIASRLQREDVVECEKNLMVHKSYVDDVADKHRDVLEILRGAVTRAEIGSENRQFVRCWDMGGQNEYEMAHSLFLARADILLFVVNLKRVCKAETREDEVSKLCYWMQLAHMLVKDPSTVQVIIVGTHKSEVDFDADATGLLFEKIRLLLSENVDRSWVRHAAEKPGCVFIAVENSTAIDDTVGSGLETLSKELKRCMKDVLDKREQIPLKWLALMDKMRRVQGDKKVLWTRKEVERLCKDFPGFPAEDHLRNEELVQGLIRMTTLTGVASSILFEIGNSEWVVSVSPERLLGMFRSVISRSNWERYIEKNALERLDSWGTLHEVTLVSEIWGTQYEETEKRAMIRLLCECDLLLRLYDNDGLEQESHALYGVPYLLRSANRFSKKKGENERMIEIVTKFQESLPRGLQGGLMANLSRILHQGLQHVDMVGRSSVRLVLKEGRVIVEYKAIEREIIWTSFGRNPLDLVDRCLKQMDEFLRHGSHPVRIRRRSVFRHKHCKSHDDVVVDHSALRRPDHEVRCKVCMVPTLLSTFWEGQPRKDNSGDKQAGDEEHFDFRFVYGDLLEEMLIRREAAVSYFGRATLDEASKGLSRRLELSDEDDIENFRKQLQSGLDEACERRYTTCWEEESFCFAVSYAQHDGKNKGRFKFSKEQWENLKAILKVIRSRGVSSCRIWLDQCLWLRDPHQRSWAVCGLFPYLLWPVIALGDRRWDSDRTTATYERMWPFVEEVLGLWSLGVITTSEQRGARKKDGCRKWMIRNHRRRLEPEESMRLLLLNIYHGGVEGLKTGWTGDVKELQDIAKWNVEFGTDRLVVRSDWRQVIASQAVSKPFASILEKMVLRRGNKGEFLDASKRVD